MSQKLTDGRLNALYESAAACVADFISISPVDLCALVSEVRSHRARLSAPESTREGEIEGHRLLGPHHVAGYANERFSAVCSCGWRGRDRLSRLMAADDYMAHAAALRRGTDGTNKGE